MSWISVCKIIKKKNQNIAVLRKKQERNIQCFYKTYCFYSLCVTLARKNEKILLNRNNRIINVQKMIWN